MPVYEYECSAHGLFEQLRPLAEYAEPAACPTCASAVARVLSAPHLCGLARSVRVAHERNERARHEPHVASTPSRQPPPRALAQAGARPALKRYTGARPWVIEHG